MIKRWVDLESPAELLRVLAKDSRLIPYGGGNFGTPPALLRGDTTPNDLFFMRSNGPIPEIDRDAWRLTISGHVQSTVVLSLDDLRTLPAKQITAVLECAGNSRTRFSPIPEGTPWRHDAVGNAFWEGVSLASVLKRTGVCDDAVDVVSQGADFDGMRRGLPTQVARDPDTMLVWSMNGQPLPIAHGGPVRLLVPGWAGIASTKWIVGLEVLDRAFDGFWNTDNYVIWTGDGEAIRPVREMPVKSIIVTPTTGAEIESGEREISGYAWSGYGPIVRVPISTDGGDTWSDATLHRTSHRRAWTRFTQSWAATAGPARLLAKATDERALTQPMRAEWNAKGYLNNSVHVVDVTVR